MKAILLVKEARPVLYALFPWLQEASQGWTRDNWAAKLSALVEAHSEFISIE